MSRYLTVKEAAELFGVSEKTMLRTFAEKGSPAFKVSDGDRSAWRVNEQEFLTWRKKESSKFKS